MSGQRTMVIINPQSGGGNTGRRFAQLRDALDKVLDRWDHQLTQAPGEATSLTRQAVNDGYRKIVSVGGDGTANEVVCGLFGESDEGVSQELLHPGIELGLVRAGTGGDFTRLLDLPHRLPDSVKHLGETRRSPCDLGLVEFVGHDGSTRRRAFINIASFGLSGVVDDKVNSSSKALGGKMSFLMGLSRALVSYKPQHVAITVDGKPLHEGVMVTTAVANGQYFGGGMRFARDASINDGAFHVVTQTKAGPREVAKIRDLYSGKLADWDSVRTVTGQVVEATTSEDEPVLLDIDGEQPGRLPAKFQMVANAVSLIGV